MNRAKDLNAAQGLAVSGIMIPIWMNPGQHRTHQARTVVCRLPVLELLHRRPEEAHKGLGLLQREAGPLLEVGTGRKDSGGRRGDHQTPAVDVGRLPLTFQKVQAAVEFPDEIFPHGVGGLWTV